MNNVVLIESKSSVKKRVNKYKCPYCDKRFERPKLVDHIDKVHPEMIPEGYSAFRVVYDYVNKTTGGKCMMCKIPTQWNEKKGRYERLCGRPECKKAYIEMTKSRNRKIYDTDDPTKDERYMEAIQKKALANRKISGEYKFKDGGVIGYTGSYEKKALEFMDKVMSIESGDIESPGPSIWYKFEGKNHLYISDFYYVPYNLIIEVKDGGSNKANNVGADVRAKTKCKEDTIIKDGKYNYLRLTDNNFSQLMEVFAILKYTFMEDPDQRVVIVNENSAVAAALPQHGNQDSYYVVQRCNNNVYDYAITKDPTQKELIYVDPEDHKIKQSSEEDKPGSIIVFKMKDKELGASIYERAIHNLGMKIDSTSYFYDEYIKGICLTDSQILFDDRLELVKPFNQELKEMANMVEKYIGLNEIDHVEYLLNNLMEVYNGR